MYDLIIIGGGPAGLTAMMYAIRKRINALMISRDLGGKTMYRLELPWYEDYQVIRGMEIVNKFKTELEYLNFVRRMELVDKVEKLPEGFQVLTRNGDVFQTRAVVIASGTRQQSLEVPGEKEFIMRGLCYSATSYAPLFIDRKTIVIGDGELAIRSAGELATVAKHVHLVGVSAEQLKTPLGKKLVAADNVTVMEDYKVVEIRGNRYAEKLVVKSPQGIDKEISAEGMFVEMGLIPNSQMVEGLLDLDEQKRIKIDCFSQTSVAGVFAAGDVTNTYAEQVLVAVGDGAKAALSAYEYLLPKL
jgi:alkyl hydroperoxide reductase subunit F